MSDMMKKSVICGSRRRIPLNEGWLFNRGALPRLEGIGGETKYREVALPHDFMIETDVSGDAASGPDGGYYPGGRASYTKYLEIPKEWEGDPVLLYFDGVMMQSEIMVNGSLAGTHHYGYTPFSVDISQYLYYGERNRITVMAGAGLTVDSRWYTGAGLIRDVSLLHMPRLHLAVDGLYFYTDRIEYDQDMAVEARVVAEVTVVNETRENHVVCVQAGLSEDNSGMNVLERSLRIFVKAHSSAVARIPMTVQSPLLWSDEAPNLYQASAKVTDCGIFRVNLLPADGQVMADEDSVLFGIRTITADAGRGLRINGRNVKLKGSCIHHDNGILGAASFYDSEYRRLLQLKESGFNAIRLSHNPPSAELLEACDRLGVYVFHEAFDMWRVAKREGDYSLYFEKDWKDDVRAFMHRDRNHPSILFWSTGNEIPERGGLGNGYETACQLAEYIRSIDGTRLISNGLCSFWSGLDDKSVLANHQAMQKAKEENGGDIQTLQLAKRDTTWEERTEPFVSSLDVVGYNYRDDRYEIAGELFPERVIVGTESHGSAIDRIWEKVERLPYIIGDFTWTGYDYLGEAGIGKSVFLSSEEALGKTVELTSRFSVFPWRLANDADMDINGYLLPQGAFRRIVWGSRETYLYVQDPSHFSDIEKISSWGWPDMADSWNWKGCEGKDIRVVVYSAAEEVELRLNGRVLGRKPAGKKNRNTAAFEICYEPGILEAVSVNGQEEISRVQLETTGEPAGLALRAQTEYVPCGKRDCTLAADGRSLIYVEVAVVDEKGRRVPDAELLMNARVTGSGSLQGFGSAKPITAENYTTGSFTSYRGRVMAVVRAGNAEGTACLCVEAEGMEPAEMTIAVR